MSIKFDNVSFTYFPKTPFATLALKDINLELPLGGFYCLIGNTGSGKSTLVQLINALLAPTEGEVHVKLSEKQYIITRKGGKKELRKDVGLVFQFPEYQLFEETIIKDVMFGPLNFGKSKEQAASIAENYLKICGIDESLFQVSPLEISGGQKRRVAIAGILAMDPEVLILDEPTAGLDPQGAVAMMKLFARLNYEMRKTIIIISHDLDLMLAYADEFILMKDGKIHAQGSSEQFFNNPDVISNVRLPKVFQVINKLKEKGIVLGKVKDVEQLATAIARRKRS